MKTLVVGEIYRKKLEKPLISNGLDVFWLPNNSKIDKRLSGHADLSVFNYKNTVIIADYLREDILVKKLTNMGYNVIVSDIQQADKYPGDINLCAAVVGDKLLHCIKYTDPAITALGLKCCNINQGYTRCCSLIIKNSIITSDKGMARAAAENGIEHLLIDEAGIILEGFDNGFIGGASFVSDGTVYFTGDILKHNSGQSIMDFIVDKQYSVCCLTNEQLFDIGGAVVLDSR